jgi:UDP-3-O-[3-hydroxymyristoyl] glucosamine N-acyltransferase
MKIALGKLAQLVQGQLQGDAGKTIRGIAPFESATPEEITFAAQPKYLRRIGETDAGAILVPADFQAPSRILLRVANPQAAFARIAAYFHPPAKPPAGISPHSRIGAGFVRGQDVSIGPLVVIQDAVVLGDRVTLHPHVFIGNGVVIGDDVEIFPNVSILERCRIGNRVKIQAGTVIGSDGFGYAPEGEAYVKIPHIGVVQIDDDVDIGAGNTIDRATFGRTWIQRGVKTDNLVQIAHNVTVGEDSVIVAQVGISGSVAIGRHAVLAGQAGIAGHLTLGDHVTVGPQAGVGRSINNGEVVSGSPEMPHRQWLRAQRIIPQLPALSRRIAELERKLERLQNKDLL